MNINNLLLEVIAGHDLSQAEMKNFMAAVLSGKVNPEQLAALLCCLKMKGETQSELLGLVLAMREKMIQLEGAEDAVDVCGTGGDQSGTFNISTAVAFVVAGAGIKVAKHGNRAASSQSGSADVLEALGVTISLSPHQASTVLEKVGLVFLFAPKYHPAMRHVAPVRKALGIPTIFNKIGPLCSPANVQRQLIGVPSLQDAELLASVARQLPHQRILIASSHDGLDEVSISAPTTIITIENGEMTTTIIDPASFGFSAVPLNSLKGGSPQENAEIIRSILNGVKNSQRDIVVLNAGLALYAAQKTPTIHAGIQLARHAIDSGSALAVLENLITETNRYA